jgi:hypothetical protein
MIEVLKCFENATSGYALLIVGTTPFCQSVRKNLNENFPKTWIGRCRQIYLLPRSPELTQMDFYGDTSGKLW